jgi:hypothetical protein
MYAVFAALSPRKGTITQIQAKVTSEVLMIFFIPARLCWKDKYLIQRSNLVSTLTIPIADFIKVEVSVFVGLVKFAQWPG